MHMFDMRICRLVLQVLKSTFLDFQSVGLALMEKIKNHLMARRDQMGQAVLSINSVDRLVKKLRRPSEKIKHCHGQT